ncbi:Protein of unknown function [Bacillus cereus]|nr:Protein of unknown function [Bacillus cereus]
MDGLGTSNGETAI